MQFLMMIYTDAQLMDALPEGEFDTLMRGCLAHADELRDDGQLLDSQQLEAPATARSVRVRNGRTTIVDGPFAETKEMLAGFNLIEAEPGRGGPHCPGVPVGAHRLHRGAADPRHRRGARTGGRLAARAHR